MTNGSASAAIEVKGLGEALGQQIGITESLSRRLSPTCGGSYSLYLGPWNTPSLDQAFVRHLKREIERVAPALAEGASTPIPIPRHATLVYRDAEWKRATCTHDGPFGRFCQNSDADRAEIPFTSASVSYAAATSAANDLHRPMKIWR